MAERLAVPIDPDSADTCGPRDTAVARVQVPPPTRAVVHAASGGTSTTTSCSAGRYASGLPAGGHRRLFVASEITQGTADDKLIIFRLNTFTT